MVHDMPRNLSPEVDRNVRNDDLCSNCPLEMPPNQALHADGARLGETTLVLALGGRPLGAGAAGERQGVGAPAKAGE